MYLLVYVSAPGLLRLRPGRAGPGGPETIVTASQGSLRPENLSLRPFESHRAGPSRHLLISDAEGSSSGGGGGGGGDSSGDGANKSQQNTVTLTGAAAAAIAAANSAAKAGGNSMQAAADSRNDTATAATSGPQQQGQRASMGPPQRVAQDVREYAARVQMELQAMQTGRQGKTSDGFQSFPLVRRSVIAALSGSALLLGAAEAAERSANGTTSSSSWRQRAWGNDVDAKVLLLLGELYSLHRDGAVHKQGVELFHVSKSGGTSFADLSALNGCLAATRHDNCLMPRPWDDRPRWLNPVEARIRFHPIETGKQNIIDWWSDSGPRQPYTFGGDASRTGYCRARLAALSARHIQFATNEYTLYGGQGSPRETFMCPELLNTIVVREPRARLMSHLRYMLPMLVEIAGTDAAFKPGGGASNVAGWDAAAPFVFDNYLARSLLGEAVFRSPTGTLRDAARFWADDAAPTNTTSTASANTAASNTKGADAWAVLASAARLVLQQFDVVMALEDGETNRPHFKRGLGWPYPVDLIHKRVGSEAKIQVNVDALLPPDLEFMLQRHTLDAEVYLYGQLFSKLDLVVWDTAAQLEGQACPGGDAAASRGSSLVTVSSRSALATMTRRATRIERRLQAAAASSDEVGAAHHLQGGVSELPAWYRDFSGSAKTVAGQAGRPADFPPLVTPPLRRQLLAHDDGGGILSELEHGMVDDRPSRHGSQDGGSSSSSSSRKLLKVLGTGVAISPTGGVQHRYASTTANVLGNPAYLSIVNRVLVLETWNVTQAVRQGLRQQQGLQGLQQGQSCRVVSAAAWGSVSGTCGWVGVKLWAASLQARGQLVA